MLKWFRKDPVEELKSNYAKLLIEARDLQRNGDIIGFSHKTAEAEALQKEIDELEAVSKRAD